MEGAKAGAMLEKMAADELLSVVRVRRARVHGARAMRATRFKILIFIRSNLFLRCSDFSFAFRVRFGVASLFLRSHLFLAFV